WEKDRTGSETEGLTWGLDSKTKQKDARQWPWLDHVDGPGSTAISRLNEEIEAFERYMSEIPQEAEVARTAQKQAAEIITRLDLPDPVLFGSRQTGMALRHSGLDLLLPVRDTDHEPATRQEAKDIIAGHLDRISMVFEASDTFSDVIKMDPRSRTP